MIKEITVEIMESTFSSIGFQVGQVSASINEDKERVVIFVEYQSVAGKKLDGKIRLKANLYNAAGKIIAVSDCGIEAPVVSGYDATKLNIIDYEINGKLDDVDSAKLYVVYAGAGE